MCLVIALILINSSLTLSLNFINKLNDESIKFENIGKCISLGIDEKSTKQKIALIIPPPESDSILKYITISVMVFNLTLSRQASLLNQSQRIDIYISKFISYDDFILNFNQLTKHSSWNSRAIFIIYMIEDLDTKAIVEILWKSYVFNMIFLKVPSNYKKDIEVYTWNPYKYGCGDNFTLELIDSCSTVRKFWFVEKIPRKFKRRCTIKVVAVKQLQWIENIQNQSLILKDTIGLNRGYDGNLLGVIAETLNLGMKIYLTQQKIRSATEILRIHFGEGSTDLGAGFFIASVPRYKLYDYSIIYQYSFVHWCVPHLPRMTQMRIFMEMVTPSALLILLTLYAILTTLYYLMSELNFIHSFILSFSIMLGVPIHSQPRTNELRHFFLILTVYSLWCNILFQTVLSTSLALNEYEQTFQSVQDIIDGDLHIYCVPVMDEMFKNDNSNMENHIIIKRRRYFKELDEEFETIKLKKSTFCATRPDAHEVMLKGIKLLNDPLLHCIKKPISNTLPVNMYMKKGYPLRERIDSVIQRILNAGLFQVWDNGKSDRSFMNNQSKKQIRKLYWQLMEPIFLLWIAGCIFSIVVFILEIIAYSCLYL